MHDRLAVVRHEADERGVPLVHTVNVVAPELINTAARGSQTVSAPRRPRAETPARCAPWCARRRFHTPSRCAKCSVALRVLGMIRTSNPHMLNNRLGLSRDSADEPVVPFKVSELEPVLDVPNVARPRFIVPMSACARLGASTSVVVSDEVLVVRVEVLGEVPLDQVLRLLRGEPNRCAACPRTGCTAGSCRVSVRAAVVMNFLAVRRAG